MVFRIGFFASHEGSNAIAIIDNIYRSYLNSVPKILICNNPDANAIVKARKRRIPAYCINSANFPEKYKSLDDAIIDLLDSHSVNLIVLAGYMKKLSNRIIEHYPKRILNIHPSLLPKYGGKGMFGRRVHKAVLDSDDNETGVTVHLVTPENPDYDSGRILAQYRIPRYENDNIDTLSQRVIRFEHEIYSQVLKDIESGFINLDI